MRQDLPPVSRVVLIKLRQNVVGAFAARLAEMLEPLEADTAAILDLSFVTSIDGYGINTIAETLARGVDLQLVGVRSRVRRMFRQARSVSEGQFVDSIAAALDAIEGQYQGEAEPQAERRDSPRRRTHIPVEIIMTHEGERIATDGIIKDMSEGGVYIELAQKPVDILGDDLDFSTQFDLQFALPDVTYPCVLQGNPVHADAAAANLYCGVKFGDITYLDEDAIRIFLYRHEPDARAGSA